MALSKYLKYQSPAAASMLPSVIKQSYHPSSLRDHADDLIDSREQSIITLFKHQCSTIRDLTQIHAQIIRAGFGQHVFVAGRIISFCCSVSGSPLSMDYASSVFEEIQYPDGFIYNTLIRGFGMRNRNHDAFSLYKKMMFNKSADNFTFCFLLKICAQSAEIQFGKQIHCSIVKQGLGSRIFVCNTLIHMYGLCRQTGIARELFEETPNRDLVSWNTLLHVYVHCGQYKEAHSLFMRMNRSGLKPDEATLVVVLSACSELGDLDFGKWIHSTIRNSILDQSISVSNSLVDMYSKCGAIDKALLLFEGMKERSTVSWNVMILGLAMHGHSEDALRLFDRMRACNDDPDESTFLGVLSACSHGGMIEEGRRYFESMKRDYRISPSARHFGCMVDILTRAGLVQEAYELIMREMPMESNAIVWRTLLGACRVHENVEIGEIAKKRLAQLEPDHSSDYVLLSHMYASKDQWSDVYDLRETMRGRGAHKPEPGNCLVDFVAKS